MLRHRDDAVLVEMLVRRAVLRARQRYALARGALARARVTAQRSAVHAEPLALTQVDVHGRDRDVALDELVDAALALHRKVNAYVVEQRTGRPREVVAVVPEPRERGFASLQHLLPMNGRSPAIVHDQRS